MSVTEDELIDRLRQGYDAFNRGDYDEATRWVHPDVVFVSPGSITELRGAEALRAWMEPDAFESQVSHLGKIEIAGDKALFHQVTRARGAGSGIEFEAGSWAVWSFDDEGRVTRMETYFEHDEEGARRSFEG